MNSKPVNSKPVNSKPIFETYASQQEHELDRLADACIAHLDWQKIQTFIPVFLEAAAMLAALTYPNLLVHLSSWG